MSRIGKLSINVPDKVNVIISPDKLSVKGPKGELSRNIPNAIKVVQNDKLIQVLPSESISTGRFCQKHLGKRSKSQRKTKSLV